LRGYAGWNSSRALQLVDKILPKVMKMYLATLIQNYFPTFGGKNILP
jgi:hypothetical protein